MQAFRDADRPVDRAVARDAVRHQVAFRSHRLAGGQHVVDAAVGVGLRAVRTDRQDAFEVADAEALAGGDVAAGLVDSDAVVGLSPEQRMNRLAGVLARDVPEGVVDSAERHGEHAAPPVEQGRAVHLVPELLDVERIGADQQVLEMAVDDLDRRAAAGPHAEAHDARVRLDDRDDRRRELLEGSAVAPSSWIVVAGEDGRVEQALRALVDVDGVGVDRADPAPACVVVFLPCCAGTRDPRCRSGRAGEPCGCRDRGQTGAAAEEVSAARLSRPDGDVLSHDGCSDVLAAAKSVKIPVARSGRWSTERWPVHDVTWKAAAVDTSELPESAPLRLLQSPPCPEDGEETEALQ